MMDAPYIAEVAALIGDPARANMLLVLKDDSVLSATELAHVAGVIEAILIANVAFGSKPEVQRGPRNVRCWGSSGSRFRATGCLLIATSGHLCAREMFVFGLRAPRERRCPHAAVPSPRQSARFEQTSVPLGSLRILEVKDAKEILDLRVRAHL